jgi:hypothetical protein
MGKLLAGTPQEQFLVPERVILVPVDLDPSGACVRPVVMAFVRGTEPLATCGPPREPAPGQALRATG